MTIKDETADALRVEQVDRDAWFAHRLHTQSLKADDYRAVRMREALDRGDYDGSESLQIFVRHRLAALSDRATDQSDEMQAALSFCYTVLAPGQDANAILRANPERRVAAHRAIYERKPHDEPYDAMMARIAALDDRASDREEDPSKSGGYDSRITDLAKIAAIAAGKNAQVAPQLLMADITFTLADAVEDGRIILPHAPARQPIADLTGEDELRAVVAWLRDQSEKGAEIALGHGTGTARSAYGGGSLALKKAADEIEAGSHRAALADPQAGGKGGAE